MSLFTALLGGPLSPLIINQSLVTGNALTGLSVSRADGITSYAENVDSSWVGFAQNVARQTTKGLCIERSAKNLVANNSFAGAVAGASIASPGTIPTGWGLSLPTGSAGVFALQIVSIGVDPVTGFNIMRCRLQGTTPASGGVTLRIIPSAQPAINGTVYGAALWFRNVAGTAPLLWQSTVTSGTGTDIMPLILQRTGWERWKHKPITSSTTTITWTLTTTVGSAVAVDYTFDICAPTLEAMPSVNHSVTSVIVTSGTQLTRNADVVTPTGVLLTALQDTKGCIEMTVRDLPLGLVTCPMLGHNGNLAALVRASNGGVSTAQSATATTKMAFRDNWWMGQFGRYNWNALQVQVISQAGDTALAVGAPTAATTVQIGSDGTSFLDGYLNKVKVWNAYQINQSDILALDADLVVHGATSGSITTALEFAKNNSASKTVIIIGDWRERHVGGMMSGGLGNSDASAAYSPQPYAGWVTTIMNRYDEALGKAGGLSSSWSFQPKDIEETFRYFLRTYGIKVYWDDGITDVTKTGLRISSLTTTRGKTITGRAFHEGGYDGNLIIKSGLTYRYGREVHDANNTTNGYSSNSASNPFQVKGFTIVIDPYNTPGVSGSGTIAGVDTTTYPATGAADTRIQAYNFRMCLLTTGSTKIAMPSSPPPGYDVLNYEILLRELAGLTLLGKIAGTDYNFSDMLLTGGAGAVLDANNVTTCMSTDFIGGNWSYPTANYTTKETIWKSIENYIRGFFYTCQYGVDSRIPAAFKTDALRYGFSGLDMIEPHENDTQYWPYCLYVREAVRMEGDLVWNGADLAAVDGTTPRSTNIVAAGRYTQDSHPASRPIVAGALKIEGNNSAAAGGTDLVFPLPMEIIIPKAAECTNLTVSFCVSSTHQAFGAIRMEFSAMCLGHGAGAMHVLGPAVTGTDIQSVNYATLNTNLAAGGAYLPTVN